MSPTRASTAAGRRRAATRSASQSKRSQGTRRAQGGARAPAKPKRTSGRGSRRPPAPRTRGRARRAAPTPRRRTRAATARPRGWRGWLRAAVRPRGLLVVAALIAVLAAGYMLWLRDLPIFAVKDVTVEGASGPEAAAIAEALDEAAREMTTLHVDEDALRAAAERFPTFVGLRTDASFPTGLRITVKERPPVLLVRGKDGVAPVAGDGTVLAGVKTDAKLPAISLEERLPAGGDKLRDEGLALALVLGAAPEPLAELVRDVSYGEEYGVEIELKGGIPLRFGGPERAGDKWAAAAAVLAEPEVTSLTYLDLRVPERPAIGGASAGDSAATEEAPSQ